MTAADFRAVLARLCWTQRGLAKLLGVAHNTVHRWALGQARIPPGVVTWLGGVEAFLAAHPPQAQGEGAPPTRPG
jgi:transcriptional regulator with XRE-family HTH domain